MEQRRAPDPPGGISLPAAWRRVLRGVRLDGSAMRVFCALLLLLPLLLGAAAAATAGETARSAPQVVFRGGRSLDHLLRLVTQADGRTRTSPRPVAIVIDATPFTAFWQPELVDALGALDAKVGEGRRGSWRVGRLGGRLSGPRRRPGDLALLLDAVFAKRTDVEKTIPALRKMLANFRAEGGVIAYLAASRFEDEEDLEPFLAQLKTRGQTFSVIGPEAGFLHPHEEGEGRTGDTAWPHVFDRVMTNTWTFRRAISVRLDLAERLDTYTKARRRGASQDRQSFLAAVRRERGESAASYPAPPSSFGPYGLMRLAAETGGHYALWSWNPIPRQGWLYDYGRCNRFAPDLRSREAILADLRARHLPLALLGAWRRVSWGACQLAAYPPPLDPKTLSRVAKVRVHGSALPDPWRSAEAGEAFPRGLEARLRALDEAITILDVAIARPGAGDAVDERYRADAELMRHVLRLYRFASAERGEAWRAWQQAPSSDIPQDEMAFQPHNWVWGGPSPGALRLTENRPYRTRRALEILRQHREFLSRFQGTPYAWIVSRNRILTYRIVRRPRSTSGRGGPSLDASRGRTPVTPGPGGSQGGGPTTGD